MTERRCIGCWQLKNRDELTTIPADNSDGELKINPDTLKFDTSVYLGYNKTCIEKVSKKNKMEKHLKAPVPNELKGQVLDELRNN